MDNPGQIKGWLQTLTPTEFEQLVGEVWESIGYKTHVTSESNDRGIDVIAIKKDPFRRTQLIQVKRYTQNNKIGSQSVREYRTLYEQESDVDSVALVTSGDFTPQAEELATDLNVKTLDGFEMGLLLQEEASHILEDWIDHNTEPGKESPQPSTQESETSDGHKYGHLVDRDEPTNNTESSEVTEEISSPTSPSEARPSTEPKNNVETDNPKRYKVYEEEIRQFYSELDA